MNIVDVFLNTGRIAEANGPSTTPSDGFRKYPQVPLHEALIRYAEGRRGDARAAWVVASRSLDGSLAEFADRRLARLDLLEGRVAAWRRELHASAARDSAAGRRPVTPFADLSANYWVLRGAVDGARVLDSQQAAAVA